MEIAVDSACRTHNLAVRRNKHAFGEYSQAYDKFAGVILALIRAETPEFTPTGRISATDDRSRSRAGPSGPPLVGGSARALPAALPRGQAAAASTEAKADDAAAAAKPAEAAIEDVDKLLPSFEVEGAAADASAAPPRPPIARWIGKTTARRR